MLHSQRRRWMIGVVAVMSAAAHLTAADHGPVFGLATPTNPRGGWSFDLVVDGRGGTSGVNSTLELQPPRLVH